MAAIRLQVSKMQDGPSGTRAGCGAGCEVPWLRPGYRSARIPENDRFRSVRGGPFAPVLVALGDSDSMKERSSWCYTRCSSCFYSPKAQTGRREILYLGIDQHRKQLTVSVRNEAGDAVPRRQVSTECYLGDTSRLWLFSNFDGRPAFRGWTNDRPLAPDAPNRRCPSVPHVPRTFRRSGDKIPNYGHGFAN